jgi:hypothetical protein
LLHYEPRQPVLRASVLDPFKGQVTRLLDSHPFSAQQIFQRLRETGYPDRLCIYYAEQLIARHARCYDRHRDIEDPNHPKALVAQRRNANEQRLLLRFLTLSPKAADYHAGLVARRLNWRNHVAKINALAEIYGAEATARAIEDGLAFDAFSCEYITNLLEARARLAGGQSAAIDAAPGLARP